MLYWNESEKKKENDTMELRVLEYFLAVAREQSISAAAQSLHLSQPTLSTQLKGLEDELGKQLLIRGTKGSRKVTLTEEGMLLRKRAQEILRLVQKTEDEITLSDDTIAGDLYIAAGETEAVRFLVKAQRAMQKEYPLVHFHLQSGDRMAIMDELDKGLTDFGLVFGSVDTLKYEAMCLPFRDTWGVLMRRDSPLAAKEEITAGDLLDKPLILSRQESTEAALLPWFRCQRGQLNVVSTYNLLFNASLMVDEGIGYAICLNKIINVTGNSCLCFRPLSPKVEVGVHIIWKKYQVLTKPARQFLVQLQKTVFCNQP